MKTSDKFRLAEAVAPIVDRARLHHKMARMAQEATPQFGPDDSSDEGMFELPKAFGVIPANYRLFRSKHVLPVLATGHWMLEEPC